MKVELQYPPAVAQLERMELLNAMNLIGSIKEYEYPSFWLFL